MESEKSQENNAEANINENNSNENIVVEENQETIDTTAEESENTDSSKENAPTAEEQIKQLNEKYLRLYSDFENFRKRTIKEKMELTNTAGEKIFQAILPVIDDFERAKKFTETSTDIVALKEGIELVMHKLKTSLQQKGLEEMKSIEQIFDPEIHEAITQIPAPSEDLKGKVVDELEKGYYLNGKVIRFAKVVVGS